MKKKILKFAVLILIAAALVVLDQLTKHWAVNTLMGKPDIILIPGVLQLEYLENAGMAFGMLQNAQIFFYIMTVLVLSALLFVVYRLPETKRFLPLYLLLCAIAGGAVGNFIDRAVNKYVVDFIYFSLIDFPVFNVADICVSVSCIILIVLLCFVYKDEELKAILPTKKEKK